MEIADSKKPNVSIVQVSGWRENMKVDAFIPKIRLNNDSTVLDHLPIQNFKPRSKSDSYGDWKPSIPRSEKVGY